MGKIRHFIEQSWLLIVASFLFGLLIAVADATWRDRILQNEEDKFNKIAAEMLTEAASFEKTGEKIEVQSGKGRKFETDIKKAVTADGKSVGWAFVCEGSGFVDKIKLVLTVDAAFEKLKGFGVLSSNETPGFGDQIKLPWYRSQFADVPAKELELVKTGDAKKIDSQIVAITGATVSSEAVVKIINNCLGQIREQMQSKGLISNGK